MFKWSRAANIENPVPLIPQTTNFVDNVGQSVRKLLHQSCLCKIGFAQNFRLAFFQAKQSIMIILIPGRFCGSCMLLW